MGEADYYGVWGFDTTVAKGPFRYSTISGTVPALHSLPALQLL